MPREEEKQVQVAGVTDTDRAKQVCPRLNGMWNVLDVLVSLMGARTDTIDRSTGSPIVLRPAERRNLASRWPLSCGSLRRCCEMGLKGVHILVIEDAPDVLDVLTTLLRLEGADVVGAANGRDALAVFRGHRFDVVVSDLGLPDIPGDVLIRAIMAAARYPLKVVVITGEREPSPTRALEAGAGVIFVKPCEWKSIVAYLDGLDLAPAA